jgi:hypothetical protein
MLVETKSFWLCLPAYHGCVAATAASDDLSLAKIGTRGAPGQARGSRRPRGSRGASWPFHALARRPLKVSYGIHNILCTTAVHLYAQNKKNEMDENTLCMHR